MCTCTKSIIKNNSEICVTLCVFHSEISWVHQHPVHPCFLRQWHIHSFTAYPPWSGVPVWVVVSLLGALVATAISVGVLPGVDGWTDSSVVTAKSLVSCEETCGEGGRERERERANEWMDDEKIHQYGSHTQKRWVFTFFRRHHYSLRVISEYHAAKLVIRLPTLNLAPIPV